MHYGIVVDNGIIELIQQCGHAYTRTLRSYIIVAGECYIYLRDNSGNVQHVEEEGEKVKERGRKREKLDLHFFM